MSTTKSDEITSTEELYAWCQRLADQFMALHDDMDVVLDMLRRKLPMAVDERGAPLWPGEGGVLKSPEGVKAAKRIVWNGRVAEGSAQEAAKWVQRMAAQHKKEVTDAMSKVRPSGPVFKAAS